MSESLIKLFPHIYNVESIISYEYGGLSGKASGEVIVHKSSDKSWDFIEYLFWQGENKASWEARNHWRWVLSDALEIYRKRYNGFELLSTFPLSGLQRESLHPYHCQSDCYTSKLEIHMHELSLNYQVRGANKHGNACFRYYACQKP